MGRWDEGEGRNSGNWSKSFIDCLTPSPPLTHLPKSLNHTTRKNSILIPNLRRQHTQDDNTQDFNTQDVNTQDDDGRSDIIILLQDAFVDLTRNYVSSNLLFIIDSPTADDDEFNDPIQDAISHGAR